MRDPRASSGDMAACISFLQLGSARLGSLRVQRGTVQDALASVCCVPSRGVMNHRHRVIMMHKPLTTGLWCQSNRDVRVYYGGFWDCRITARSATPAIFLVAGRGSSGQCQSASIDFRRLSIRWGFAKSGSIHRQHRTWRIFGDGRRRDCRGRKMGRRFDGGHFRLETVGQPLPTAPSAGPGSSTEGNRGPLCRPFLILLVRSTHPPRSRDSTAHGAFLVSGAGRISL